ncbi:restriction endonuclease [Streptomyces sp. S.PNR 29]|uniref:restriction endonuclease n=1 Tax=Streptomyces sp. S.PNR 29 TaxID=2973805 RepID=UPI0025AFDCFF|nr:restriction endonuclease [Streptomyces sp. S.PNR 29]MDN0193903.1 restriction endonuclease [Streptomyces sp. S.PNR 29]
MDEELITLAEGLGFIVDESENATFIRIGCMGLSLVLEKVEDGKVFPYLQFQKAMGSWVGDPSDIIDVTSYMAAAYMHSTGRTSYQLVDVEDHPVAHGELSHRFLVPRQPISQTRHPDLESLREAILELREFGEFMHIVLPEYCPAHAEHTAHLDGGEWARTIAAALPDLFDIESDHHGFRGSPEILYYRTADGEISITQDPMVVSALKQIPSTVRIVPGPGGEIRQSDRILTAVSDKDVTRAARILSAAGEDVHSEEGIMSIPLENALLCAGAETVVLINSIGGRQAYQEERERIIAQHRVVSSELLAPNAFTWAPKIDGQDFEDMVRDLLEADPTVTQVRSVGPANERDGGKDLLVRMRVPNPRDKEWGEGGQNLVEIPVVVQCKATANTVGTGDVREIRDVIEDAGAEGFILVTSSRVSAALTGRLETIRTKNGFHTDWWDRVQLEIFLRANPDIVSRYPNVVQPRH